MRALLAVLVVGCTIACVRAGNGDLIVAATPALVLGFLYAAWTLPLRGPLLVTTFLVVTLENPSDVPACGQWKSPFYEVGAALLVHLNVTLPVKALIFSGLDVVLVALFVITAVRCLKRSAVVPAGRGRGIGPIGVFAGMSVLAAAWMWLFGMMRGGADVPNSLWQVQRVVYLPVVVFLFQFAIKTTRDAVALGKVFVAAASLKAALALYIRATVPPPPGEPTLQYATTHADSMLFGVAFCAVVALLIHRKPGHRLSPIVAVLPLLAAGMVANGRRLAWVELGAGLLTMAILTPWSAAKRKVVRGAVLASPLLLGYLAAGWGATGGVFSPVHTIRSVVDSKADPSTMWRDLENYDLFYTLRHAPLFGTGYGHGYVEFVPLPDVTASYPLERFVPHNAILGLWAYGGVLGFTMLWAMIVVGIYLTMRAYRAARQSEARMVALTAVSVIVVYLTYCYGDLGLGTWVSVFTVAPALAIGSRLAVTTGGWPSPEPAPTGWRGHRVDAQAAIVARSASDSA